MSGHTTDASGTDAPSDFPSSFTFTSFEVNIGLIRITSGLVLLFTALVLGFLVKLKPVAELDHRVLEWCVAHRSPGVTVAMEALTALFAPTTAVIEAVMIGVLIGLISRSVLLGVYIPASMAFASAFTTFVKDGLERVRPPLPERIVVELSHSYPSGHTTAAAALAVSAAILAIVCVRWTRPSRQDFPEDFLHWSRPGRRILILFTAFLFVVLIGATRLYLGAHWLSDVLGGACVGAGSALFLAGLLDPRPR